MDQQGRGPYRGYTKERLLSAVQAVQGGMAIREAVRTFEVKRSTLQDRVHNRVDLDTTSSGPRPCLTKAEEALLCNYIKNCARIGFPLDKNDLLDQVKKIMDDDGRPNKFVDNRPGT